MDKNSGDDNDDGYDDEYDVPADNKDTDVSFFLCILCSYLLDHKDHNPYMGILP